MLQCSEKKKPGFSESGRWVASLSLRGIGKSSRKWLFLLVQRDEFFHLEGLHTPGGLDAYPVSLPPSHQTPPDRGGDRDPPLLPATLLGRHELDHPLPAVLGIAEVDNRAEPHFPRRSPPPAAC